MIISPFSGYLTLFRDLFPFPSILFSLLFSVRELKGGRKVVEKDERKNPTEYQHWLQASALGFNPKARDQVKALLEEGCEAKQVQGGNTVVLQ